MTELTHWATPKPVDDVNFAFPANVIGKHLPPLEDIPEDYKASFNGSVCRVSLPDVHKYTNMVNTMFSGNTQAFLDAGWVCRDHFTSQEQADMSMRQISVCLRSYQPKHEHKIAGVAWLMSLFFMDAPEEVNL